MNLFKDKYSLTLTEVSLLFATSDARILCRKGYTALLPSFLVARAFARFSLEFAETFNRGEVSDLLTDDFVRLKIENKIHNLYAPLYRMLLLSEDDRLKGIYKKHFGKDYEGLPDLKLIISEIQRLKSKYQELDRNQTEQGEKISFAQIITYVEMALNMPIPRDMKLFEFKELYDMAVKLINQRNNGSDR